MWTRKFRKVDCDIAQIFVDSSTDPQYQVWGYMFALSKGWNPDEIKYFLKELDNAPIVTLHSDNGIDWKDEEGLIDHSEIVVSKKTSRRWRNKA